MMLFIELFLFEKLDEGDIASKNANLIDEVPEEKSQVAEEFMVDEKDELKRSEAIDMGKVCILKSDLVHCY